MCLNYHWSGYRRRNVCSTVERETYNATDHTSDKTIQHTVDMCLFVWVSVCLNSPVMIEMGTLVIPASAFRLASGSTTFSLETSMGGPSSSSSIFEDFQGRILMSLCSCQIASAGPLADCRTRDLRLGFCQIRRCQVELCRLEMRFRPRDCFGSWNELSTI